MFKHNEILQPLGLATILAIGFGIVIGLLVAWGFVFYDQTTGIRNYDWDQLLILKDGTPIIQHYAYIDGSSKYDYRTLDGKALPKSGRISRTTKFQRTTKFKCRGWPDPMILERYSRLSEGQNRVRSIAFWYFIQDGNREGKGYFIGYDPITKLRIGYVGRKGFDQNLPAVENQFPWWRKLSKTPD